MTRTFKNDLAQNLRDLEFAKGFGAARAKSNFAITLAEARRQLNLTQQQLAVRLGVSQAYIAKLEGGEANPTLGTIGSLLAMLGLSLTTDTTTLSPYPNAIVPEAYSFPEMSLMPPFAFERVTLSDATEGRGSSSVERELVKIALG